MPVDSANGVISRPRVLQFRLVTLLLAMVCIGIACAALAMPTAVWAGILFSAVLLMLLTSILLIVYGNESWRAFAIGFLVFAGGYFVFVLVADHSLNNADIDSTMPVGRLANHLFFAVYAKHTQPRTVYARNPGMPLSGSFGGSPPGGLPLPSPPVLTPILIQAYRLEDIGLIMHSLFAIALGAGGSMIATMLRKTQSRSEKG